MKFIIVVLSFVSQMALASTGSQWQDPTKTQTPEICAGIANKYRLNNSFVKSCILAAQVKVLLVGVEDSEPNYGYHYKASYGHFNCEGALETDYTTDKRPKEMLSSLISMNCRKK